MGWVRSGQLGRNAQRADNLVLRSSFEDGRSDGWSGSVTVVDTPGHPYRAKVAQITGSSYVPVEESFDCTPGEVFTLRIDARSTTPGVNITPTIQWYDKSGAVIGYSSSPTTESVGTTVWTIGYTLAGKTAPAGAARGRAGLSFRGAGGAVQFTDVVITRDSTRLVTRDADPGAIGAGAVWVRTSHPMGLHVRNSGNSGWIRIGGGGMQVQKQQIFTASGTFTPPPGMVAQGGHCEVLLVGGGQSAGGTYSGAILNAASAWHGRGGAGGCVHRKQLAGVMTPQTVTIGAGGVATTAPAGSGMAITQRNGGKSSFGTHMTALGGGDPAVVNAGTHGVVCHGESASTGPVIYRPAHPGVDGYGQGGYAARPDSARSRHARNSGSGGSFTLDTAEQNGQAGICIVTWWEAAE